jgi:hypothetical protein
MTKPFTNADLDACGEHVAEFGELDADLIDRLIAELRRLQSEQRWNEVDLKMLAALRTVDNCIGGWREVIAELDDLGKSEAVGKAMWACLNQIDRVRPGIRAAIAKAEQQAAE